MLLESEANNCRRTLEIKFNEKMSETKHIAELAKSGRASCKKCSTKIEDKSLRLGKAYDNGGHMCVCRILF